MIMCTAGGSPAGPNGGIRERGYLGVFVRWKQWNIPLPGTESTSPGRTSMHRDGCRCQSASCTAPGKSAYVNICKFMLMVL